jgi:hypothetical protein
VTTKDVEALAGRKVKATEVVLLVGERWLSRVDTGDKNNWVEYPEKKG